MISKALLIGGWAFVGIVAVQALPVTRLVYAPDQVEIRGDIVTVHRTFPMDWAGLPRPFISYVETVRPMTQDHNGGQACESAGGPFQYTRPGAVGQWSIEWAQPCTSDPVGVTWSARWTWHLGGIELGPAQLSRVFLRG